MPSVKHNLMLVSELDRKEFEIIFKSEKVIVRRKLSIHARGDKIDGMYYIIIDDSNKIINSSYVLESKFNKIDSYVRHTRLGYINKHKMKRIQKKVIIPNM